MNIKRKPKKVIELKIPKWAGRLYIAFGIFLVPWVLFLTLTLPNTHHMKNWNIIWTGFDIGLLLALICTGIAAFTRSVYIIIAASATGTLLLVDAWFDLISESNSPALQQALMLALLVEVPLALLSFYVASHALRYHIKYGEARKTRKR